MVHLIAYDLHESADTEANYSKVANAIKMLGGQLPNDAPIEVQKSVWLVDTSLTAKACLADLKDEIPSSANLIVTRIRNCRRMNVSTEAEAWLEDKSRRWKPAAT
jgi:CRISPR-associated endonuclease Cas2